MKRYFFTLLLLVLVSVPPLAAASTVTIPDPKLRAAVKKALGAKADAEITAAKMAELTNLKAAKSKVSDLTGLEYAINLTVLKIANNRITDISPLGGLTALKELGLFNNRIKNISPLARLTNLQKLNIRRNSVADISPLRGLTNLKELRVGDNRITDVQPLTGLTGLTQLYIAGNSLTNAHLLSSLTGLTYIDITIPDPPDTTEPEVTITVETEHVRTASKSVDVNGPFRIIIEFTEPVSDFDQSDIWLEKGSAEISNFSASGATTYTADVTPALGEDDDNRYIRFVIPPGAATDAAGNPNRRAEYGNAYIDMEPPNVYITAPTSNVTAETFTVSIKFAEHHSSRAQEPFGFDQWDLSFVNDTAGATVTGWSLGTNYITTATISVTQSGSVTLRVPEGVATDRANNSNTASLLKTVTVRRPGSTPPASTDTDTTEPEVTITAETEHMRTASKSVHVNGPFRIIIEFTEPVSDFDQSDIWLEKGRAEISNFRTGENSTYTADVIPELDDDNRYIRLVIPPGAATDAAGNPNRRAEYGNAYIDMERPNVYITAPSNVTAETFTVSIKFAEHHSWSADQPFGFDQSDLSLVNNTAGATVTGWSLGTNYITTATISVARSGSVTLRVPEGVATNRANNSNTASLLKTVTVRRPGSTPPASTDADTTEPEATITVDTGHVRTSSKSVYVNGPFRIIIAFTEPVSNFEQSDILLAKGRAEISNFSAGENSTYTADVTPYLNEGNRYIRFVIPPGAATDAAGNPNVEAAYGNAWIDMERPNVYITAPSEVTTETFTVSIKFAEHHSSSYPDQPFGFDQWDLSLVNDTVGATVTSWSVGTNYITTATISVTQSGSVTLRVPEGVATDSANNSNTASLLKTVVVRHPNAAPSANGSVPNQTHLQSNYPNPFNPETWIPYQLANDSDVRISIYDLNGGLVRQLDLGYQQAGYYTNRSRAAYWDGRNEFGEWVATGIYFYHLSAGEYSATRKMIILK